MDIPTEFLTAPDPDGEFTLPVVLVVYANPGDHFLGEHRVVGALHDRLASMAQDGMIHEEWNYVYDDDALERADLWGHPLLPDWQHEVRNGDTLRSFREYLEHRAEVDALEVLDKPAKVW